MPQLLSLSASPRQGGNSEIILQSFCEGVGQENWHIENIRLNKLTFRPCQACDNCAKDGVCVLKDDMSGIYEKLVKSDALVLSSPIYFGSLAAQAKMFIDRFQCWWQAKYNIKKPFIADDSKKPGFFLCVGALRKADYCENAGQIVKVFFHNINYQYTGHLFYRGFDEKGCIKAHPEILQEVYATGRQFALAAL